MRMIHNFPNFLSDTKIVIILTGAVKYFFASQYSQLIFMLGIFRISSKTS